MRRWLQIIGLLVVGLGIGAGLGLYLGWVAWPTEYTDADPSILQEDYRRDYVLMVAAAYEMDGNLAAAAQRINDLGADSHDFLLSLLLDMILQEANEEEIRQVARLAADLGLDSPAMGPYLTPTEESGSAE